MSVLLPKFFPSERDFDSESFYEAVAATLEQDYQESDVQSFDWLIEQLGQAGNPCHEAAHEVYSQIVHEHRCDNCGCDSRVGYHGALRSNSWHEPSYHCYGERRQFPK